VGYETPGGTPTYIGSDHRFPTFKSDTPFHMGSAGTYTLNGSQGWDTYVDLPSTKFVFAELSLSALASASAGYGAQAHYDFENSSNSPPLWLRVTSLTLTITNGYCFA
jgi:hypothetical protein